MPRMIHSRPIYAAAAIVVAACQISVAMAQQQGTPPTPAAVTSDNAPYVIGLPVFYYTPETKLAFGVGGMLGFWLGHEPADTRPSSLPFVFVYTQNKQTQLLIKPEIYLPGNAYLLSGTVRFERMPQKFFGIGQAAASSAPEFYTPQTIGLQVSFKKRFSKQVWAGLEYEVESTTMREIRPGGLLASGAVTGSDGGLISGLGISANYDTRDSVMFPRRGRYLQVAADRYTRQLGSDFDFTSVKFDFRSYYPVRESDVAAVQVYVKSRGGSPPFYQLSFLGGDSLLRGYYRGQYRDTAVVVAQAEYRAQVWKRLSAAMFAGLGEACPGLDRCSTHNALASFGGGLHIKLDSKGGTNLRIEYALGRNSRAFYMTVQEAF